MKVLLEITILCLSGTFSIKNLGRSENSVAFSNLDSSEWYGAYVEAQTRSGITRKSKFIKGRPYGDGNDLKRYLSCSHSCGILPANIELYLENYCLNLKI